MKFENTIVGGRSVEALVAGDVKTAARINPESASPVDVIPLHPAHSRIPFTGLLTNKLLAVLPGSEFARLLPHLEPVSLKANAGVSAVGKSISFAYFPETAVITHLYLLADGTTAAAAVIGSDGMIGLSAILDTHARSHLTQVTISGSALRIDIEILKQEFARGEVLQQVLLSYTGSRLSHLSQKAVCNGRHKLNERLCTWLLMVHDRAGQGLLSLTHEQIAHYLGARRAGVTNACNTLRQVGTMQYRRGVISILDRAKLESAACECYPVFRQISQQPLLPPQVIPKVERASTTG